MSQYVTKVSQLMDMIKAGDWISAIKFAGKFSVLGDEKANIQRAREAILRPELYKQIGKNPDILIEKGKEAIQRRYARALKKEKK